MPISWIGILLLWSYLTPSATRRRTLILISTILFFFFTNVALVNIALKCWEIPATPIAQLGEYEQAIVLTGVTQLDLSPEDRVFFSKGADRVLHTVQLYKLKKVKRIIITGGHGKVFGTGRAEAPLLKNVFIQCGVNAADIIVEDKSFNTRENALFTRAVMDSLQLSGKSLLVTSAFHMRRAKGCFDKVGLATTPYPCDYYTKAPKLTPDYWLIPNAGALENWNLLFKEWIGYLTYTMMGYR